MLKGKHIILGISGGIAAYKSVHLLARPVRRCRWSLRLPARNS